MRTGRDYVETLRRLEYLSMLQSVDIFLEQVNIFQIWRYLNKVTPFIVQRTTSRGWLYYVTKVEPRGKYGCAYGWPLPPGPPIYDREYPVDPHRGETGIEAEIPSAGSYQWQLIPPESCPQSRGSDLNALATATYEMAISLRAQH